MRRTTEGFGPFFVAGSEVRVVVADRDERTHEVARAALSGVEVAGSRVILEHAWSAEEATARLGDVAVLVLEAELDARAVLLHLREELGDGRARVLLRAGPDLPLDEAQLEELRVDGFVGAEDLATPVRLYVAVRTALRSYAHAAALEKQVDGLGQIAEQLSGASTKGTLGGLLRPLVEDIASNCWTNDWLCVPFLDDLDDEGGLVLAGGAYAASSGTPAGARAAIAAIRPELDASPAPVVQLADGRLAVKFLDPKTRATQGLLLVATQGPVAPRVRALAQGLGHKLAIARQNIELSQKLEREKEAAREIYNDRMGMLGRLAASVAHELNTPLGIALHACSLLGEYGAALREEGADRATILADLEEAVGLVVRNVTAAANLVRSFKGMAVDQASDQDETFEPAKIVTDAVGSLVHVLRPKGQTVRLEGGGASVRVTNNPGALSQVVNNLVLNASKHGYKDGPGEIVVRHEALPDAFELTVEDRGEGMDERVARRVFEPFVTTARDKGGSGLGMSIVHHIVTATYRGTIDVESTRGQGTRFRVRFPLGDA